MIPLFALTLTLSAARLRIEISHQVAVEAVA